MWSIITINNETQPHQSIAFSDGLPWNAVRGVVGNSFRLIVDSVGFLDITDAGHQPNGPHYWMLVINGADYWYDGQGALTLTVANDGSFNVTGDGNNLSGNLIPLPVILGDDIENFDWMIKNKFVPYQDIPDEPGKTVQQLAQLGQQYFPFTPSSFELAMSMYDWTTADFARIQFFQIFCYTQAPNQPLDLPSIAEGIWTSNWGTYNPQNVNYMNAFMMQPANSLAEVQAQLNAQAAMLAENNMSEVDIICAALESMPRTSVIAVPQLFSGQVDISNLGTEHFAAYFQEFPLNADPGTPLQMPFEQALELFIQIGKPLTLKGFMSFTDSKDDAMHYSNGILVIVTPPVSDVYWTNATFITPLSDGPEKIEYLFPPGTSFMITNIDTVVISGKTITEIYLQAD